MVKGESYKSFLLDVITNSRSRVISVSRKDKENMYNRPIQHLAPLELAIRLLNG